MTILNLLILVWEIMLLWLMIKNVVVEFSAKDVVAITEIQVITFVDVQI